MPSLSSLVGQLVPAGARYLEGRNARSAENRRRIFEDYALKRQERRDEAQREQLQFQREQAGFYRQNTERDNARLEEAHRLRVEDFQRRANTPGTPGAGTFWEGFESPTAYYRHQEKLATVRRAPRSPSNATPPDPSIAFGRRQNNMQALADMLVTAQGGDFMAAMREVQASPEYHDLMMRGNLTVNHLKAAAQRFKKDETGGRARFGAELLGMTGGGAGAGGELVQPQSTEPPPPPEGFEPWQYWELLTRGGMDKDSATARVRQHFGPQ